MPIELRAPVQLRGPLHFRIDQAGFSQRMARIRLLGFIRNMARLCKLGFIPSLAITRPLSRIGLPLRACSSFSTASLSRPAGCSPRAPGSPVDTEEKLASRAAPSPSPINAQGISLQRHAWRGCGGARHSSRDGGSRSCAERHRKLPYTPAHLLNFHSSAACPFTRDWALPSTTASTYRPLPS
jgi:hypothetical protein